MAQKSIAQIVTDWATDVTGGFPTNLTKLISALRMRNFVTDLKDSVLFIVDHYEYYYKATTASGTDTYTIDDTIPAAYTSGERFAVTFTNSNLTTSPTLNRATLGAKALVDQSGSAPAVGQILAGGTYLVRYDGTNYVMLNLSSIVVLSYGTYTPTLTDSVNVSSSTAQVTQYMRVGSVVTVAGVVNITPTAGGGTLTNLKMSLPVASNFASGVQAGGTAVDGFTSQYASIISDSTNDVVTFEFKAQTTSSRSFYFSFSYLIV